MRQPRHSTVVAYLALFVALSGSAYAAVKIGSKQIKDNSVRSRDIKNKTIAAKDISTSARKSLRGQKGAPGAPGAQGAAGTPGDQGPAGPSAVPARAVVVGAGGTPAENGTALRNALSSLPAATQDEPRGVVLGPGRYDLEGTGVTVPSDVTLAGAGAGATIIDSSPANVQLTMLTLGERTTVRDLTVRTASAPLGSVGIDETGGNNGTIKSVNVSAGTGVIKRGGLVRDAAIDGAAVGMNALAVGTGRVLVVDSSRVSTLNNGATTGFTASTSFTISDSQIFAASLSSISTGVRLTGSSGIGNVRASLVDVSSGGEGRGISVDTINSSPRVEVDASEVDVTGAPSTVLRANFGDIRAGASELSGNPIKSVSNGASVTCFGTYTGGYVATAC
jgi:hypothetical protein